MNPLTENYTKGQEELTELHQIFHDESKLLISPAIDKALRKIQKRHKSQLISQLEVVVEELEGRKNNEDTWIETKDGSKINPAGFYNQSLKDSITFIKEGIKSITNNK